MSKKNDEFEKLIGLAEIVSDNVHSLHEKVLAARFKMALLIAVLSLLVGGGALLYSYALKADELFLPVSLLAFISISIIFVFVILLVYSSRHGNRILRELKIESRILHDLLDMIHELETIEDLNQNLTLVEKATLRIRLKRISFSDYDVR